MINFKDKIKTPLGIFCVMGYDSLDEEYWLIHLQDDMDQEAIDYCLSQWKADIAVPCKVLKDGIANGTMTLISA